MLNSQDYGLIIDSGTRAAHVAFTALGGLVGSALTWHDARSWPIDPTARRRLLAAVTLGALLGCALPAYFVGGVVQDRAEALPVGPKTILGGVLLSYFAAVLYKKAAGLTYDTSDAFARGTAWLMAIGRLGCHFQHCCFGIVCDPGWWALELGDGRPRIPVQLLEFAGLTLIAILIEYLHRRDRAPGRRLFVLYVSYGTLRFLLEFLREPVATQYLGVGAYQWLALALAGIGGAQIFRRSWNERTGVR